MSLRDYEQSIKISAKVRIDYDDPFYALLFALMREADTNNLERLKAAFPEECDEFQRRYHAPLGVVYELDGMTPEEYYIRCKKIELGVE